MELRRHSVPLRNPSIALTVDEASVECKRSCSTTPPSFTSSFPRLACLRPHNIGRIGVVEALFKRCLSSERHNVCGDRIVQCLITRCFELALSDRTPLPNRPRRIADHDADIAQAKLALGIAGMLAVDPR